MEDIQLNMRQSNSKISKLVTVALFVVFVPSSFNQDLNRISLYILIPFLFLYSFIKNPRLLFNYKPIIYLLLLLCWSSITMIKSINIEVSLNEIKKIVGSFLLCYIVVHLCFHNVKYITIFYILYILKFFVVFYYGYTHGLEVTANERFNLDELNANMFGYYGFFAIVSSFFLWQFLQSISWLKKMLFVLFVVCLTLSVMSCFYAASRAGIMMSISMATLLIMIYYFYPLSKKYVWGILMLIVILTAILPLLNNYYKGSILESRMQIENLKNESRYYLAQRAITVGLKNPLFGVGPGNYMLSSGGIGFSHSTYTELLANNGITGLLIFLVILYYFFRRNVMLFSSEKVHHKEGLYFFSFILLYCIYNLFYGFHVSLFLMAFFFLMLAHLETFLVKEED